MGTQPPPRKGAYCKHIQVLHKDQYRLESISFTVFGLVRLGLKMSPMTGHVLKKVVTTYILYFNLQVLTIETFSRNTVT